MSMYFRIVLNAFLVAGVYGLLLPWMISQSDDMLVIGGIFIAAFTPAFIYYFNRNAITQITEKFK